MTYPEPSETEVLEALSRTGFLMEQRVAKLFEASGLSTVTGKAYPDPTEGKSREMDCVGWKTAYHDEEQRILIGTHIVAECKNTQHPHVVIGRSTSLRERMRAPEEAWFSSPTVSGRLAARDGQPERYLQMPRWRHMGLHDAEGSPSQRSFTGDQLLRLQLRSKEWSADNDGVFDKVVYPLAKSIRALQSENTRPRHKPVPLQDYAEVLLMRAVLVTTSPIFEVDADGEEPAVRSVPWTMVTRELKGDGLTGTFNVDIVSESNLSDWLQQVLTFTDSVAALVRDNPDLLWTSTVEVDG